MLQRIKDFWNNHPITTHSLAIAVVTLTTLYTGVPAFRDLVNEGYAATPAWFHKVAAAALGIWAFYHGTNTASK